MSDKYKIIHFTLIHSFIHFTATVPSRGEIAEKHELETFNIYYQGNLILSLKTKMKMLLGKPNSTLLSQDIGKTRKANTIHWM